MQYVRSISGSVSKTWNSINPATFSGAIDVIVVEQEDGSLACSPFHVRFGKFQLLRPSEKKVEFRVNGEKRDYPMKLGEGGEAFFVFETSEHIPPGLQTSPLVSPAASPEYKSSESAPSASLLEPEPLDLAGDGNIQRRPAKGGFAGSSIERPKSVDGTIDLHAQLLADSFNRPASGDWSALHSEFSSIPQPDSDTGSARPMFSHPSVDRATSQPPEDAKGASTDSDSHSNAPPPVPQNEAYARAINLSKKLWGSNIPTQVSPNGDLMLDMAGYKSSEEQALRTEVMARKILAEELEGNFDIGALIGADEKGNLWIYHSEEAKEAADRKAGFRTLNPAAMRSADALSDPGYHSDDGKSNTTSDVGTIRQHTRRDSDSAVGLSAPGSPDEAVGNSDAPVRNFAKTLRLTSDQLKALDLKHGENFMTFTVNKSTCPAYMYYWRHNVPIVISDIDGTITKSDALGHLLNMVGRDWTHVGVAKLYTDIVANGYNILYLTSRSVGQADLTRGYLNGVTQDGHRLPRGPVIMSPDRTMAALRRELYIRKPEVFKMACLRDIMNLYQPTRREDVNPTNVHAHLRTPFYAGFGNRLTDALSYRSVSIPPTRIFTINSNAEVNLHLLTLNRYRMNYLSIWELVDHYFPPVGLLVKEGGEEYTDFNYWRETPLDIDDFSASESEYEDEDEGNPDAEGYEPGISIDDDAATDLEASYMSRDSIDEPMGESGVLDTLGEDAEEEEELTYSTILEEPEEMQNDELLVEESEQLDALDLAAVDETTYMEDHPHLQRAESSPERRGH